MTMVAEGDQGVDIQGAFEGSMKTMTVVGAAAGCRGKGSSKTADQVAVFLINLACNRKGSFPFLGDGIELIPLDRGDIALAAASCFGGFLSVRGGNSFWKQRVMHKCLPIIIESVKSANGRPPHFNPRHHAAVLPVLAPMELMCHIMCCVPIAAMKSAIGPEAISELVKSLGAITAIPWSPENERGMMLCLSSLLRILVNLPDMLNNKVSCTAIARALSMMCMDLETCVTVLLLALQFLTTLAKSTQLRDKLGPSKVPVLSCVKKCLDHPSSLVRQSAVYACIAWSVNE